AGPEPLRGAWARPPGRPPRPGALPRPELSRRSSPHVLLRCRSSGPESWTVPAPFRSLSLLWRERAGVRVVRRRRIAPSPYPRPRGGGEGVDSLRVRRGLGRRNGGLPVVEGNLRAPVPLAVLGEPAGEQAERARVPGLLQVRRHPELPLDPEGAARRALHLHPAPAP